MSNTPEFVAHALDLLAPLGFVEARRMFGGHGLYARGVMFGILDDEELFLRADDEARPTFAAAGCRQWSYPTKKGPVAGDLWRPPDEAHEDPEAMRPWAELGLTAALRKAAARAAKGMGKKAKAPVKQAKAPSKKSPVAAQPKATPAAKAPGKAGAKGRPAKRAAPKEKASRR